MIIRFVLRVPGAHREIIYGTDMDAIPREGETVTIADRTHTVHSVSWEIAERTVTVLLRE